jgi:CheY-like chemotaxis protein
MDTNADRIRVLYVDAKRAPETGSALERERDRLAVETAASAIEALDRLAATSFDCVVSGLGPADADGVELLEAVRSSSPDLPFVVFADAERERAGRPSTRPTRRSRSRPIGPSVPTRAGSSSCWRTSSGTPWNTAATT